MSVIIMAPLPGDTVASPVAISTAYDFTAGACTITTSLTGATPSTSGSLSGIGLIASSLATTSTGPVTATSSATPSSGGSNSVSFNIGAGGGPPPIIIETIDPTAPPPPPPPPGQPAMRMAPVAAPMKDYNVKGSIKGTGITQVKYRVLQVDLATFAWTVVVPYTDANVGGNNWHVNGVKFTPAAKSQYAMQVTGYNNAGQAIAQFTKAIVL